MLVMDAQAEPGSDGSIRGIAASALGLLRLSVWVPGAFLCLGLLMLYQFRQRMQVDFGQAVSALTDKPTSNVILVIPVVLAAVLLQAISSKTMKMLTGEWETAPLRRLRRLRVARNLARKHRLLLQHQIARLHAFDTARRGLLVNGVAPKDVDVLEGTLLGRLPPRAGPTTNRVLQIDWKSYADPSAVHRVETLNRQLVRFPRDNRVQPTRLGNVLAAGEDLVRAKEQTFDRLLRRQTAGLEPLLNRVKRASDQLEMFADLVLVSVALAVATVVMLQSVYIPWGTQTVLVAGLLAFSWICYEAAVQVAQEWVVALANVEGAT